MKYFNTAGPCNPSDHYMLPATARLTDENVEQLIAQKSYFIVHAPRQTGKTTAMLELARTLTERGDSVAVLVSMEVGAAFPSDIEKAELAILSDWREAIRFQLPEPLHPSQWQPPAETGQRLSAMLAHWAAELAIPLIVFLDEIDALENSVLISVLRQLRSGYNRRPARFPAALALIGLRDVRDYKVASGGTERLNTPSPFNIAVRSITLRNFTQAETEALLDQHRQATGQAFAPAASAQVFALSQGQPWLVNALAKVIVEELVPDPTHPITPAHIETAKEILIARRQTHLDQLADKLQQPRVRRVIKPMMAGGAISRIAPDDLDYVIDLGLCRFRPDGGLEIANPIYQEIIPQALSYIARASRHTSVLE